MPMNDKKRGKPSFTSHELRGRIRETKSGVLYVSSTSFLSFAKCPYAAYHLKYKPQEIAEEGPRPAALCFGTAVHAAMESLNCTGIVPVFMDYWEEFCDVNMSYTEAEQDYMYLAYVGTEILNRFQSVHESEGIDFPYVLEDGFLAVEKQDTFRVSPRLYLGRTFDLIAPVRGIPTVIDYKTAARMYTPGNQDLLNEQLTAYLLPHRLEGVPQPEQAAFLVGTKTQNPRAKLFIVRRDEQRLNQLLEDLESMANMLRGGNVVRNRSVMSCGTSKRPYCDLWEECYGKTE